MPKQIPESELDAILQVLAQFPEGVSLTGVADALAAASLGLPRRTLQRRLSRLVALNKLTVGGHGRGTRYFLRGVMRQDDDNKDDEDYIKISPEAEAIKRAIRRSIQSRRPVGYRRDFLDAYRPNETHYLPSKIRKQLFDAGNSQDQKQPAGTYAKQIFSRLLIDLTWNSSRLEGNTYSLLETGRLLELGEAAEGKDALEAQMILNHKAAIEFLIESANDIGFHRHGILNLHALLSDNLLSDPRACGRLRSIPVGIAKTTFHPLAVPQLIDECFQQILDTASAIDDPLEQSFFAMVHLPYLQPFEDVNKRVSRLAANIPFIRQNLCPLSFIDVPERAYIDGILGVYELNDITLLREVFIWAYKRSCSMYSAVRQSLGDPDPFRLKNRTLIGKTIADVVRGKMPKTKAITLIKSVASEQLPASKQSRFVEVVESELLGLHAGNIARYRLGPTEFAEWQLKWKA